LAVKPIMDRITVTAMPMVIWIFLLFNASILLKKG
jgi:hypothetical protein